MYYIFSILAGLVFGGITGYIKYLVLWKKFIVNEDTKITAKQLYGRMAMGAAINVVILAIVFITRNIVPLEFMLTILATAVALSLTGKLAPIQNIVGRVKEDESC